MPAEPEQTPVERVLADRMVDDVGVGKPLSDRARHRQRTVESYLRGEALPRYITRLRDIERATRDHERLLAYEHAGILAAHPGDLAAAHRAWVERLRTWDFTAVNELVWQHNAYYPIERDLPMDPRTGDYVLVSGKDFRRSELGADWALARFPVG